MASPIIQPNGIAPIAGGQAPTPQYQSFFRSLVAALESGSGSADLSGITVAGTQSVSVSGTLAAGSVTITLTGDTVSPGNTWFYGTDTTGARGWYSLYDAADAGTGLVKLLDGYAILGELDSTDDLPTTGLAGTGYLVNGSYYAWSDDAWDLLDVTGVLGYRLDELADSGEGAVLVRITRDAYGRVSGTAAAVLDDLADVDAAAPADGDVLVYDAASGIWKPGQISGGGATVLPLVTGEIVNGQPVFVIGDDGGLIYVEI